LKNVGKVIHLFISQKGHKKRIKKFSFSLDKKGIIEDKFYDKDIQRSVLITSIDSYILTQKHNISIPQGALGENLLINYNPYQLSPGVKLHIGEDVILEISQYCTICDHLSIIDKKVPTLLKNDRGIFAKVLKEGVIAEGDNIYVSKN